jgi:Tn3 transposase DDE domain
MPRRSILSATERESLLALTDTKDELMRLCTLTAAIVLGNTIYLERATSALRNHGQGVDDTLLQCLSPLGWAHVNLTGDYLWLSSTKIGAGKFRQLRSLQPG